MNFTRPLILASTSPRRQFLMREAGYSFSLAKPEVDESYPAELAPADVPRYLAEKKAKSIANRLSDREVLMTSDTVVILDNKILNKPNDRQRYRCLLPYRARHTR